MPSDTSLFQGDIVRAGFGAVFTALLFVACVTDVRSRRIPNALVLSLILGGIAFSAVAVGGWSGVVRSLAGLGLGFTIWIVFYVVGVLGAGDVKLAAAAGAWLGAAGIVRASLLAGVVGGALALTMLARERRMREAFGRIATSMSTGSLALLKASAEGRTGADAVRARPMPYGVALAIGALAAAWFPELLAWGG